ncbi:hypothetical protein Tco_0610911 [Tanacetum coccineum]
MRDYAVYEQLLALCEQEAEGSRSGPKRRTYILREREDAEQRLIGDYVARDVKTLKFKRVQESAMKDIKRAFGVLQGEGEESNHCSTKFSGGVQKGLKFTMEFGSKNDMRKQNKYLIITKLTWTRLHTQALRVNYNASWAHGQVLAL